MARRGGTGMQYRVCVGDTGYDVRISSVSRETLELEIDGQTYSVQVSAALSSHTGFSDTAVALGSCGGVATITAQPNSPAKSVPASNGSHPRASNNVSSTSGSPSVIAPMPGVVVAISVAVGQTVQQGSVVAVIEAMKMENSICASCTGVISEVHVEVGREVERGQAILSLA